MLHSSTRNKKTNAKEKTVLINMCMFSIECSLLCIEFCNINSDHVSGLLDIWATNARKRSSENCSTWVTKIILKTTIQEKLPTSLQKKQIEVNQ